MNPDGDSVAAAERLAEAFKEVSGQVETLTRRLAADEARNRWWRAALAVLAVAVVASGIAIALIQVHNADVQARIADTVASAARAGERERCENTNRARAEQVRLWDRVLPAVVDHSGTAAGRAAVARLREQVAADFAPESCFS